MGLCAEFSELVGRRKVSLIGFPMSQGFLTNRKKHGALFPLPLSVFFYVRGEIEVVAEFNCAKLELPRRFKRSRLVFLYLRQHFRLGQFFLYDRVLDLGRLLDR